MWVTKGIDFLIEDKNCRSGKNLILLKMAEVNSSKSLSLSLIHLLTLGFLSKLLISNKRHSGAKNSIFSSKRISRVVASLSRAATKTKRIYPRIFFVLNHCLFLIILPYFIASSSVRVLLERSLFIFSKSCNLVMMECRATSDQLIYLNSAILRFNSVGIASVREAIKSPPVYYVSYV